jgi:CRISP-associated protein Cas1
MTTLYLTEPGTVVRYTNQTFTIIKNNEKHTARLQELDLVVIFPGVQLTDVVIAILLDQGIETLFLKRDGSFRGRLQGHFPTNPLYRLAQYRVIDSCFGMALAQRMIYGKITNQRILLQRRHQETQQKIDSLAEAIDNILSYRLMLQNAQTPYNQSQLMGIEGVCAANYYQALTHYFPSQWNFHNRNRRPPLDPINALLSWGYGVLLARVFAACVQSSLDPYLGFFHSIEPYRPNLVLDLMEEFRPVIVDFTVINLIKQNLLEPLDFEKSPDGKGIWVGKMGKKIFLAELEKRFQTELLYPPQNRRLKLSQIMVEQARSLGRCFLEFRLDYEPFILKL